jgi:hypothetical protein
MYLLRKWKLQSIIYMYIKDPYSSSTNTITIYVYSIYPSVFNPYIYNPSYIWVYPNYIPEYVEFHFEAIAWFSYTSSVPKRMEFSSFKVILVETWNHAYALLSIIASELPSRTILHKYLVGPTSKNLSQLKITSFLDMIWMPGFHSFYDRWSMLEIL